MIIYTNYDQPNARLITQMNRTRESPWTATYQRIWKLENVNSKRNFKIIIKKKKTNTHKTETVRTFFPPLFYKVGGEERRGKNWIQLIGRSSFCLNYCSNGLLSHSLSSDLFFSPIYLAIGCKMRVLWLKGWFYGNGEKILVIIALFSAQFFWVCAHLVFSLLVNLGVLIYLY